MWWNIYILRNIWLIPNYSVNKKYFVVVYSSGSWYPVMTYMYCMTMPAWSIFSIRSQAPQWQWDRACNSLLWFHFNKSLGCKVKMTRTLFGCSCEFSFLLHFFFQIPGFVSDDEEYMFDGSGSGSGCFDITTVSGLCDVSLKIRLSINIKARTRYVHVLVIKLLHNFFGFLGPSWKYPDASSYLKICSWKGFIINLAMKNKLCTL